MRILFTLILLLTFLMSGHMYAQQFPVDTLVKNGPLNKRINLVFLSDGYQASELPSFRADVNRIVALLFTQAPLQQYRSYFNVFAVRVPSAESGDNHPRTASDCPSRLPQTVVNNYFGSSFDQGNIHRLLWPTRLSAVSSVLAASFPLYDQVFVVVNTPIYGGGGSSGLANISAHPLSPEVAIHELGHSFAYLGDEYWAGPQYARERPNMTAETNLALVKWAPWLNTNNIGLYPHTGDPKWFKPHPKCRMQVLGEPFCSVCQQAFIERIHEVVPPIQSYSPATPIISNPTQDLTLALNLLAPTPNTLRVTWRRDGTVIARNQAQLTLPLAKLTSSVSRIVAEVTDTTQLTRAATHLRQHTYSVAWTVERTALGVRSSAAAFEYAVQAYPNPVTEALQVSYSLKQAQSVEIHVYDLAGRHLATPVRQRRQAAGTYTYRLTAAQLGVPPTGQFLLVFDIGGSRITHRFEKQ